MKTLSKTSSNSVPALAPIESVALDAVTGGCAACGQNGAGAAGQAMMQPGAGAAGQGGPAGLSQLASLIGSFAKQG